MDAHMVVRANHRLVQTPPDRIASVLGARIGIDAVGIRPQIRRAVAVVIDVIAPLPLSMEDLRIHGGTVGHIGIPVPVDVPIADISHTVQVMILLEGIVVQRAVVLRRGHSVSVYIEGTIGSTRHRVFSGVPIAHAVPASGKTIHRARLPVLPGQANPISAHRAVNRAVLPPFLLRALPIATVRQTLGQQHPRLALALHADSVPGALFPVVARSALVPCREYAFTFLTSADSAWILVLTLLILAALGHDLRDIQPVLAVLAHLCEGFLHVLHHLNPVDRNVSEVFTMVTEVCIGGPIAIRPAVHQVPPRVQGVSRQVQMKVIAIETGVVPIRDFL
jgi:hypothetical protein